MEKNKITLWTLVFGLFLFCIVSVSSDTIQLEKGYLRFEDLKKRFPGLQYKLDPVILVGEIHFKNSSEFKFRVDSTYYIHRNNIESLPKPILYISRDLYLPKELVEAIFIYLIDTEVSYKFTEDALVLNLYQKVIIQPEEISL
nr:N-acetylmuramoyl-L-alanine amidase [Leptospiraceae bacterium]